MTSARRTAAIVGVMFLVTHVTSVAAQLLYGPALADPTASGTADGLLAGIALELVLAPAVVGTAVALFALLHRHAPGLAAGYLALRTLEAAVILTGVVAMLALHKTQQAGEGADAVSVALAELGAQAFIVGPGFVCGVDTIVGALLVLRTGVVPRVIPILGLIGGPLVLVLNALKLVDGLEPLMPWIGAALLPVWAWELSLALTLLIRGPRGPALSTGHEARAGGADDRLRERVEHG